MTSLPLFEHGPPHPVFNPDGDSMFEPKWFVAIFALSAVALLAFYDIQFGLAASVLVLAVVAIVVWLNAWLASDRRETRSERAEMTSRFARLARNRRTARIKELGAQSGPDAS